MEKVWSYGVVCFGSFFNLYLTEPILFLKMHVKVSRSLVCVFCITQLLQ